MPASLANKLYAAADVVANSGLVNMKIEDIAAASGVPKATLYYYFTGKEEILSFLFRDLSRRWPAMSPTPLTHRDPAETG